MKKITRFMVMFICLGLLVGYIPVEANTIWNGGKKINFVPYSGQKSYKEPNWQQDYMNRIEGEYFEDPNDNAIRWQGAVGILRVYQDYLKDEGYSILSSNGASASHHTDFSTLVPASVGIAREEVGILQYLGVISGRPNEDGTTSLQMGEPITRAELARILATFYQRTIDPPKERNYIGFIDVEDHWAEEDIKYSYERELVNGRSDDEFGPDDYITVAEVVQILINMAEGNGITDKNVAKALNETFYITTMYDDNESSSTIKNQTLITADEYYYTVNTNKSITINITYDKNKTVSVTTEDDNIQITSKRSNNGTMSITLKGLYAGNSAINCSYTTGRNTGLNIPIFVRNNSSYGYTAVRKVEFEDDDIYLDEEESRSLRSEVTVTPSNATYKEILYVSTRPDIVEVDLYSGRLIAGRTRGTSYIYAIADGKYDKVKVTVNAESSGSNTGNTSNYFYFKTTNGEVARNKYLDIKKYLYNSKGYNVTFKSNTPKIATINSTTGRAYGVSRGTAEIQATGGGYTDYFYLTVSSTGGSSGYYYEIDDINFYPKTDKKSVGDTFYLEDYMEIEPSNADTSDIRFSSDDKSIATIGSSTGKVTCKKAGKVTLIAKVNGITRYFYLTVTGSKVYEIILNDDPIELKVGESYDLLDNITIKPNYSYDVIFTSSNQNVATITTSSGKIEAVGEGKAKITIDVDGFEETVYVNVGTKVDPKPTPKPGIHFNTVEVVDVKVGDMFNPFSILEDYAENVEFSVSDGEFAKVEYDEEDKTYKILILKAGKTITLTAKDSTGATATLKMRITN